MLDEFKRCPDTETAIRVGLSDGANLGSHSVFQSTSMAPTSSEIYSYPVASH
ncbi:hypothetical protein THAOC_00032, partial [Thalassiosira oceanica]